MNRDDEACLKLGREVVRMINELRAMTGEDTGYVRREINFLGGSVHLFIAKDSTLADVFDDAAESRFDVQDITPPSQLS